MNNKLRIGVSGGQADLKRLIEILDNKACVWEKLITHFSLGIRYYEPFDVALGEQAMAHGVSLAIHPVDINFSAELDVVELHTFKRNLADFPFIYLEEDLGLWRYKKLFLGAHQTDPPLSDSSLLQAARNIKIFQDLIGIPIVIENPPVYSGDIGMDFWEYYNRICQMSGCNMAFDVGHYLGYCKTHSIPFDMPNTNHEIWNSLITVHLSGMKSWTWNGVAVWLDQHADRLDDQILQITKKCIENGKALHNILLEMEGATNEVRHQNILLVNAASRG